MTGECGGTINMKTSDETASAHFLQLNSGCSPIGISTPISDTVELTFVVGGRQRLKEFGSYNASLSGALVSESGGIRIVEVTRELHIPMNSAFQPAVTPS